MVLPSRCTQGFRLRRQRQVEVFEHGDLKFPPAHRSPGPVNPAAHFSNGPQTPLLSHQGRSRAKGMLLVRLFLQRDHACVWKPMSPTGRPPLCSLSVVNLGGIGLDMLPFLFLQPFTLALQLCQLLCLRFYDLPQSTMFVLQGLHPLLQGFHLLRRVTSVVTIRLNGVTDSCILELLQRLAHAPGLVVGHHCAVVHAQGLCRGNLAPIIHQSVQQVQLGGIR